MTDAAQPVGHESEALRSPTVEVRLSRRQSALVAVGSLVLVYGFGFCVMLAGGAVIHVLEPARHLDIYAALHRWWVVGPLLGISVLWLLPPHPWAKRVVASRSPE